MPKDIDKKLDDVLDIQSSIKKETTAVVIPRERSQNIETDYKYTRENLYGLVERGQDAIEGILDVCKETENPRAYEVAGQLIKTVGETTEKLIDLQAKMKELDKNNSMPDKVQNNLFVGSSAELQKLLKNNAQE